MISEKNAEGVLYTLSQIVVRRMMSATVHETALPMHSTDVCSGAVNGPSLGRLRLYHHPSGYHRRHSSTLKDAFPCSN
jgi:hypothetical protein